MATTIRTASAVGRQVLADARGLTGHAGYDRRFEWRGRSVKLENRGPDAPMGRFGGGWEREVGVQLGPNGLRGTIIVNLWRGSVRINPRKAGRR